MGKDVSPVCMIRLYFRSLHETMNDRRRSYRPHCHGKNSRTLEAGLDLPPRPRAVDTGTVRIPVLENFIELFNTPSVCSRQFEHGSL